MLFVVAMESEAKPLIEHYGLRRAGTNSIDLWENFPEKVQLIVTGVGVNNVIRSLSKAVALGVLGEDTDVINVGYAGAIGIDVGEVVCVSTCHCLEFPKVAQVGISNRIKVSDEGVVCYSSYDFVTAYGGREHEALFDMELAYVARFIYRSLYSIKIVSDNLNYEGFQGFNDEESWKKAIEMIEEKRRR